MTDRRVWTQEEEDLLITFLQEIVFSGGRADNGIFRSGTYENIATKMRARKPDISITSKHVQNKIKRLKGKYSSACDMLNTSGFVWNNAKQHVSVESPQILEDYLKKHPTCSYTPNKPFRAYERLKTVFGKDPTPLTMVEFVDDNINMKEDDDHHFIAENLNVPPIRSHSNAAASVSSIPEEEEIEEKKDDEEEEEEKEKEEDRFTTKKRKRPIDLYKLVEETNNQLLRANIQMEKLVSVISGSELSGLSSELKRLGLGVSEIIGMGKYFGSNMSQYGFWKSLEDDVKLEFVKSVYDKDK